MPQCQERQCTDQEVSSANASMVIFFITWWLLHEKLYRLLLSISGDDIHGISISSLIKNFQVWKNFECEVSESGICSAVGRVTPEIYLQIVSAVNESYALEHYTLKYYRSNYF